jgi:hypothetical protein
MAPGRAGQHGPWLWRFAAWLSQGANLILFNGSPDETCSGRSFRLGTLYGNPKWLARQKRIDRIFGEGHCAASHEDDVRFAREILAAAERARLD